MLGSNCATEEAGLPVEAIQFLVKTEESQMSMVASSRGINVMSRCRHSSNATVSIYRL
jgi:hypothetical protein